jgi:small subunit ribosomal protein S6
MYPYETVFILTPALSSDQARTVTAKFRKILKDLGANIIHEESWGPRGSKKSTGYYQLFEFLANGTVVSELDLAFKRDERVLRFMTVRLDKPSVAGTKGSAKKSTTAKKAATTKSTAVKKGKSSTKGKK